MKTTNFLPLFTFFFISVIYAQDYHFNTQNIPESLKGNANSVIRFENVSIEMKSQREMIIKVEKAITIFNKLADKYANVTLYHDKRRAIKNITAFIYNEFGKEIKKIRKKEFKDYSATGDDLYGDSRVLYYNHTPISYPYTIYYTYEVKTSNTAFIRRWMPISSYSQSVQKSTFSIHYPTHITLRKSEKNFHNLSITSNEAIGMLSYELNTFPAVKYESFAPFFLDLFPNVKFGVNKFNLEGVDGEANNWKEFGKWYYDNLIISTLYLQEATKQKIQALTANTTNPIEKAKIVYEYVQNKVRYISIQVGIGGYKPMPANDVDQLGYGDCKALTNYTASLLKEVGIASYHTLIYANEKRNLDADVAAPEGNHMILYVPISGKDIWLECTNQKNPFNEIGVFTNDRDALVITPEGGIMKHTRIYKIEENLQLTKGSFEIDSYGAIKAKIIIESSGIQYGDNLKSDGVSKKQLAILFKEYLSNINNIKFSQINVYNNKEKARFEENLEFTASDYASFSGNQMLIPINAFNKTLSTPKRFRNRKLPFKTSNSFIDIDEVEITLPSNFTVEYMPTNIEIESKFGFYSIQVTKIAEHIYNYRREFRMVEGEFPKEEYEAYRKFRKQIRKYDNSKIILNKL